MVVAVRGIARAAESGVVVESGCPYLAVTVRLGESRREPRRFRQVDRATVSVAGLDTGEQQPPLVVAVALSGCVEGVALLR